MALFSCQWSFQRVLMYFIEIANWETNSLPLSDPPPPPFCSTAAYSMYSKLTSVWRGHSTICHSVDQLSAESVTSSKINIIISHRGCLSKEDAHLVETVWWQQWWGQMILHCQWSSHSVSVVYKLQIWFHHQPLDHCIGSHQGLSCWLYVL